MSAPTVSTFTPAVANWPIVANATVTIGVTLASTLRDCWILAYFANTNLVEAPWDGVQFSPFYRAQSSLVLPGGGYGATGVYTFSLIRQGGWPAAPSFVVHAIDTTGLETALQAYGKVV